MPGDTSGLEQFKGGPSAPRRITNSGTTVKNASPRKPRPVTKGRKPKGD